MHRIFQLLQWQSRSYISYIFGMKVETLAKSCYPRARSPDLAEDRCPNHTSTPGALESKTSMEYEGRIEDCKKLEPEIGSCIMAKSLARSLVGVFSWFVGSNKVFRFKTRALDAIDTPFFWFDDTANALLQFILWYFICYCLDRNMSKRPGQILDEQVSAKSKPIWGHCTMKKEAMGWSQRREPR